MNPARTSRPGPAQFPAITVRLGEPRLRELRWEVLLDLGGGARRARRKSKLRLPSDREMTDSSHSKHILNAQVSIRAPCCQKWFDVSRAGLRSVLVA